LNLRMAFSTLPSATITDLPENFKLYPFMS
jgi:hypothetical protein